MGARRVKILVACQPKSGSTFLAQSLAALPGLQSVQLVPDYGRREQEICERRLIRYRRLSYVAQHHVRWSVSTDELIRQHGLFVVVLVRNLFDAAISLRDHVRNESEAFPMAFLDKSHQALSDSELQAMIVRMAMPWYVSFYMSWRGQADAQLLRYEDLAMDPQAAVRSIARAAGMQPSDAEIEGAVGRCRRFRFNRGIVGRGTELTASERGQVRKMLGFYPEAAADPYVREMLFDSGEAPPAPLSNPTAGRSAA